MKYILVFTTIITLGSSCGLERNQVERSPASGVGQALLDTARELNSIEEQIATRICFAFRNKRLSFSNIHLGDTYNFTEMTSSCDGSNSSNSINPQVATDVSGLFFTTNGLVTFRIETDIQGYLDEICSKLTKGEKAQNIYSNNGENILYTFDTLNGKDQFGIQIAFSSPQSSINLVRLSHEYEVQTSGSNSRTLGLVTSYTRTSLCSGSNQTTSLTRTYNP